MSPRSQRSRRRLRIELLEERNAPSRAGGLAAAVQAMHHHAHGNVHQAQVHHVQQMRHDDPPTHNANDHRGGHDKSVQAMRHDDPPNHNANDMRQGHDDLANHDANDLNDRRGLDDPANHDANDLNDRSRHDDPANHDANDLNDRSGHDDPANHDANDDKGRDGGGHR